MYHHIRLLQRVSVFVFLLLPFSCMEQDEVFCDDCIDPPSTIDCGEDGCDGDDADEIVAEYMLQEVVVTATPLNSSSPKTTNLGDGTFFFSGGSWGSPFPNSPSYSSRRGRYRAAPGGRAIPFQPRDDAPRNLPSNPKDGAVVYVKGKDGKTTRLVYNKEYGAWVMPELTKLLSSNDFEIDLSAPVFNGAILTALAPVALAEPSPAGEIILAGATVVAGVVYMYNLAQYYTYSGDLEHCIDLYDKRCDSRKYPCDQCLHFCRAQGYWDYRNCPVGPL